MFNRYNFFSTVLRQQNHFFNFPYFPCCTVYGPRSLRPSVGLVSTFSHFLRPLATDFGLQNYHDYTLTLATETSTETDFIRAKKLHKSISDRLDASGEKLTSHVVLRSLGFLRWVGNSCDKLAENVTSLQLLPHQTTFTALLFAWSSTPLTD